MPKLYYELTYLIQPGLNEAELKETTEKVGSLIGEEKNVLGIEPPQKIKLAYPIKKNNWAFLASVSFQTGPENALGIKKGIEKYPEVLRSIIVKKQLVERVERITPQKEPSQKGQIAAPEKIEKKKPAVEKKATPLKTKEEMDELEKDLEKILDFHNEGDVAKGDGSAS